MIIIVVQFDYDNKMNSPRAVASYLESSWTLEKDPTTPLLTACVTLDN
jgi:hypothetical protein